MQQSWSVTEKETFAVYQSVLIFDLYLRGAECILCCDHKLLEPFSSKGIKIPKLNRLSMEFANYNIVFLHIKGKNNGLVDAISRLKTLDIYKESLEKPKIPAVSNMQGHFMEICATDMHTSGTIMICTEQKWGIICKTLESQSSITKLTRSQL